MLSKCCFQAQLALAENEKTDPVAGSRFSKFYLAGVLCPGGNFAIRAEERLLVFLVEVVHDVNEARHDLFADAFHEIDALAGDLNHDLAAVVLSVKALDITEFLKTIDQSSRCCGGVSHFLGDIRHGQEILVRQIPKEEELGERNISLVQFLREIQEKRSLCEHDEVGQATGVLADGLLCFFLSLHS